MDIGVVGLGLIGSRMANNWRLAGHTVYGWNRTPGTVDGVILLESPAQVVRQCDIVMVVVADPPALRDVVEGSAGIASQSLAGKIVMNAGTVGAVDNRRAADVVRRAGGRFLETPFTGSKVGAEERKLIFYVGGDAELLDEVKPLLLQIGSRVIYFGAVGHASDAKLAMNFMLSTIMEAMAEAFVFAEKAGIPLPAFREAFRHNAGWSPLADMKVPKMVEADYSTHFALKHMAKDIRLAASRSAELSVDLPLFRLVDELYEDACGAGHGDSDFSAIYRHRRESSPDRTCHSGTGAPPAR